MGNFMRRSLAFILGMVFMLVVLVGGIGGAAYWAYKNLKLGTLGIGDDGSELSEWTIEDTAVFVMDIVEDPEKFTISELEKRGLNVEALLSDVIDFSSLNQQDLDALKSLPLISIFDENGLNKVNMGVVFLFLPKNEETGRYPLFSEGARSRLRQYNLGDFINEGPYGSLGAVNVLRSMKLGSVLSEAFTETYSNGEYTYSCEDKGLNLFANVQLGMFTALIEGADVDLGYEVMEGYLTNLKSKSLREILASFGAADDATYTQNFDKLAILGDVTLGESFVWNEELLRYELDTEKIMTFGTIGSLIGGYAVCTNSTSCPVHDDVSNCDGELYKGDVLAEDTGLLKIMLKNLANKDVMDLAGGFEITSLFEGVMLGEALGYEISYPSDACLSDCELSHEHKTYDYCQPNCNVDHPHNYYFVDKDGFVGELYNEIGNLSFEDALNGTLDIEGVIEDTTIGDVMGYRQKDGVWVDENSNEVKQDTLSEKIFYKLYGKKVGELSSVEFEELVDGIKLADVLGYEKCVAETENCPVHTDICGESQPYWFKKVVAGDETSYERASALYNVLCDIELDELSTNPGVIDTKLRSLYVGDLMGYSYEDGIGWTKADSGSQVPLTAIEGVMAEISLADILDGNFDLKNKIDDLYLSDVIDVDGNAILSLVGDCKIKDLSSEVQSLYVGEIMGYSGYVNNWSNTSGKVTGFMAKIADLTIDDLSTPDKLQGIIDGIVIGDVIDNYNDGVFEIIDLTGVTDTNGNGVDAGDVLVSDMPEKIKEGVKTATFHDLLDAGLIEDDDGHISAGLNNKLPDKNPATGNPYWWEFSVTEILDALIALPTATQ